MIQNPSITCNDIVADVEARLDAPNLGTAFYLPIISTAAQRVYQSIAALGQEAKEKFFGTNGTINLTINTLEHDIYASLTDFASFIDVEIVYGATGDTRNTATKLRSASQWRDKANVSTTYRSKALPLYYQSGGNIGIIPISPETGAIVYVRYVLKLPQYTDGADVINIPYRFIWPITDYVHAKAIQKENEDYSTARQLEVDFGKALEEITERAADEINENDVRTVEGNDLEGDPMA